MGAVVHPSLVSQVMQHLPNRLVRALDAWSHRIARRRAEERQRRYLERKAAAHKAPAPAAPYRLKPWRD